MRSDSRVMPFIARSRSSGRCGGAAAEELRIGAHRGERRPQLVRGVGDEAPEPALRLLPRAEGRFDVAEHRVERKAEPTHLGPLLGALDAAPEVAGGDRSRGRFDRVERAQPDPHDPEPERCERRQHRRGHEQHDQEQAPERVLDLVERRRRDQRPAAAFVHRDADAITPFPVLRRDGQELSRVRRRVGDRQVVRELRRRRPPYPQPARRRARCRRSRAPRRSHPAARRRTAGRRCPDSGCPARDPGRRPAARPPARGRCGR